VSPEDLVGVSEIAAMFDVAKNTAWRWSQREDFPGPEARLSSGPIWKRTDVKAWGKQRLPLPAGRPRRERPD
jgi:predicted DNA-binding transcriptional regulator AlpA